MEAYNRIECFLLCVLADLFYLSFKILALYCRVSGQVRLSVCLFKDLIAPSAWLILSSADRLGLHFRFYVDGLWRQRFLYCSVLGSLVLLWGRLSRLWHCCLGCLGFLGTSYGGICSSSSDLLSRSSSLAMSYETSILSSFSMALLLPGAFSSPSAVMFSNIFWSGKTTVSILILWIWSVAD